MRDLIDLITNISESSVGLSAGEISKYDWRFKKFIEYIENKIPFTTVSGDEVVLKTDEAERFKEMYDSGVFKGTLKAVKAGGGDIALSQLAKTGDFGGAAVSAGQPASSGGKEALVVKPSQIGICDKEIPAADFYEIIKKNAALKSTEYGKVVIDLASYIVSDEYVMLPNEYTGSEKEKVRKAIVDYAGEYLGVLALLYKRSRFPRRDSFEKWMGSSIDNLTLNFPSKANTNIADSYAEVKNPTTQHTINISSKGTGGGAAPAISGLKMPNHIKSNPEFGTVVEFIEICQKQGTISQAFSAMDLIYKVNPNSLAKKWTPFLPFSVKNPKLESLSKASLDAKKNRMNLALPKKYAALYSDIAAKGDVSDGGKLIYAIKKEVAEAINTRDGIPGFEDAILQILEMNFIQQYTDYKNGQLLFSTQWPAKLDGEISVENKSSAADPTAGGFSFKLGRTDKSVSSEIGSAQVDEVPPEIDDTEREEIKRKNVSSVFRPEKVEKSPTTRVGAGRERRRPI